MPCFRTADAIVICDRAWMFQALFCASCKYRMYSPKSAELGFADGGIKEENDFS